MEYSNYVPGQRRAQVTPLYDTYTANASASVPAVINFFDTPQSSSKGAAKTNMVKAYELPAPDRFVMHSLRIVALGCDPADILALQKNYTVRFIAGGALTIELEAPMEYWAGGAGTSGFAATTATTTTISAAGNGIADPRAVASLGDYPIVIESGDHFEVQFVGTAFTAAAAIFLRVYLDGVREKGVRG